MTPWTIQCGELLDARADALVLGVSTDLLLGATPLEETLKTADDGAFFAALTALPVPEVGTVVALPGGSIAKHVLLAVLTSPLTAPTEDLVIRCVTAAMTHAHALGCAQVAFPPLGVRVSHFPMESSAAATLRAIADYAESHDGAPHAHIMLPYDADLPAWEEAATALRTAPPPQPPPPSLPQPEHP